MSAMKYLVIQASLMAVLAIIASAAPRAAGPPAPQSSGRGGLPPSFSPSFSPSGPPSVRARYASGFIGMPLAPGQRSQNGGRSPLQDRLPVMPLGGNRGGSAPGNSRPVGPMDVPDRPDDDSSDAMPENCSTIGEMVRSNTSCSTYYVCTAALKNIMMQCPTGLHFNQELKVCDWPNSVNCEITTTTTVEPTRTVPPAPSALDEDCKDKAHISTKVQPDGTTILAFKCKPGFGYMLLPVECNKDKGCTIPIEVEPEAGMDALPLSTVRKVMGPNV